MVVVGTAVIADLTHVTATMRRLGPFWPTGESCWKDSRLKDATDSEEEKKKLEGGWGRGKGDAGEGAGEAMGVDVVGSS